eukprot:NODE_33_length_36935_cov_1.609241.p27 type:complete len:144 gc:universal NODE_33_length_36935_cov_1.609241:26662-27093(+)
MELLVQAEKLKARVDQINERIRNATKVSKEDLDQRSVYIGNVDYNITPSDLYEKMIENGCTNINRVTILCNQNGTPKGFAYAEFESPDYVEKGLELTGLVINGRDLRVSVKRTNVPGMGRGGRGGRGRGRNLRRGRARGRYAQ